MKTTYFTHLIIALLQLAEYLNILDIHNSEMLEHSNPVMFRFRRFSRNLDLEEVVDVCLCVRPLDVVCCVRHRGH